MGINILKSVSVCLSFSFHLSQALRGTVWDCSSSCQVSKKLWDKSWGAYITYQSWPPGSQYIKYLLQSPGPSVLPIPYLKSLQPLSITPPSISFPMWPQPFRRALLVLCRLLAPFELVSLLSSLLFLLFSFSSPLPPHGSVYSVGHDQSGLFQTPLAGFSPTSTVKTFSWAITSNGQALIVTRSWALGVKEHHHSSPKLKSKSVHLILSLPIPKTTSDLIPTWCSPETWLSVLPSHASGSTMPLLKNNTNYGSNPFSLLPQRVQHLNRFPPNSLCFRNRIDGSLAGDTGPSKSLQACPFD